MLTTFGALASTALCDPRVVFATAHDGLFFRVIARVHPARQVSVAGGAFTDPAPYGPHNARVYRFVL